MVERVVKNAIWTAVNAMNGLNIDWNLRPVICC
jgi:hypothetical protein